MQAERGQVPAGLPGGTHPQDEQFVSSQLAALPRAFRQALSHRYASTKRQAGRRDANVQLRTTRERIRERMTAAKASPSLAGCDDAIRRAARKSADQCGIVARRAIGRENAYQAAARVCERMGIEPAQYDQERQSIEGALARMECPRWWRRRLRQSQARAVEGGAIDAGVVGTGKARRPYASNYAVERKRTQDERNREIIEQARALCEDTGEEIALSSIVAASMANPAIRRAELMTRVRGFDEAAEKHGHSGEFLTITCPSRFHSQGGNNRKFDGSTPREAQAYLRNVWAKIRATWAKRGIRPYGLRVAEPHTDGCPHWHLLVFLPADQADAAVEVARAFAMAESADEPGADEHRFKRETIDRKRGSAAAYVAKYVAKAIDGQGGGFARDMFGAMLPEDMAEAAERIRAWASTWGIRQFQQVGGPPVTVWRELRRMAPDPGMRPENVERARLAADAGEWAAFVDAMGGPTAARADMPITLARWKKADARDCYGDEARPEILGLRAGPLHFPTRVFTWSVNLAPSDGAPESEISAPRSGAPWTRGNNCNQQPEDVSDGTSDEAGRPDRCGIVRPGEEVPGRGQERRGRRLLDRTGRAQPVTGAPCALDEETTADRSGRVLPAAIAESGAGSNRVH